MPARILVAEEQLVLRKITEALAGYELIETTTLSHAKQLLTQDGIDLIVVGIHVDQSQAIELIQIIRAEPMYKETPIIAVRFLPSQNAKILRGTLQRLQHVHKISAYLELEDDPRALKTLRDAVEKCLSAHLLADSA